MKALAIAVGLLALLALGWIVVHAAAVSPDQGTIWLTATGVVVAFVALAAAAAAVVFAYPAYRDWRISQPGSGDISINIWAASAARPDDEELVEGEQPHVVSGGTAGIFVRVSVHNNGRGVVRAGMLNILVPETFRIEPQDDPRIVHYLLPGTLGNSEIEPGTDTKVRATAARDDFPPGVRTYHVIVSGGYIPGGTSVTLFVELDGTGLQSPKTRRVILVARPAEA